MDVLYDREFDPYNSWLGTEEEPIRWFDIETKKVEAPEYWPYKTRWQPFMISVAGVMDPGVFFVTVLASDDEKTFIEDVREMLVGTEARYAASRMDFDQMVLRGKFTNARRGISKRAGRWPTLNGADIEWKNVYKELDDPGYIRKKEVVSKLVPGLWKEGDKASKKLVVNHCLRDVVDLVLRDPDVSLDGRLRRQLLALMGKEAIRD